MRTIDNAGDWLLGVCAGFETRWGRSEPTGEPLRVRFRTPPAGLPSLEASLVRQNKLLSGQYRLVLTASWEIPATPASSIKFLRSGRWKTTGAASLSRLCDEFNGDDPLLRQLRSIHLDHLDIETQGDQLRLRLIPYGGGIVYATLPPAKFRVPIPDAQRVRIADSLEALGQHVENHFASRIPTNN